jgi:hypothetical protein
MLELSMTTSYQANNIAPIESTDPFPTGDDIPTLDPSKYTVKHLTIWNNHITVEPNNTIQTIDYINFDGSKSDDVNNNVTS